MSLSAALVVPPLQTIPGGSLEELLTALVVIGVVILVSRIALRIAWRLVTIAVLVVGVLFVITRFAPYAL